MLAHNSAQLTEHFFRVEGMHCVKCIRKIQKVGEEFQSLKSLTVHLGEHLVVTEAREDFPVGIFAKKIQDKGFSIKALPAQEQKAVVQKENRALIARIGIAGFCAGNIMLLSAAEYLGAELVEWPEVFKSFEFLCFLPVITYSAWPLYQSAWASFKAFKVSIDSPIVLALLGGALLSSYNLFFSKGEVYFDSLSMFIFFLMSSRFVVQKIQNKYVSGITTKDIFNQAYVERKTKNLFETVKVEDVQVGDCIKVPKDMFIVFDSILSSHDTLIDDSLYTGEFMPTEVYRFDKVYAGSKNIGKEALFEVVKDVKKSRLSSLIKDLNSSLESKTALQSLADKGAGALTYAILASAFLILAYFFFFNIEEGVNRVLALLVVACPCGLAIAAPLVQSLGVKRSLKNALLIKDVSVFESVEKSKSVVFDKTGTLTLAKMKVVSCSVDEIPENLKRIIYNLELQSEHPIAMALKKYIGTSEKVDIQNLKETPGAGVEGVYLGDYYHVSADLEKKGNVALYKNKIKLIDFTLEDELDPFAKETVECLRNEGLESYIISGDTDSKVIKTAESLSIPIESTFSGQGPEDKENIINTKLRNAVFVGDGVNDSLAMAKSQVSVSMSSAADIAFKSSKVHILKGGVSKVGVLLKVSRIVCSTIRTIIVISLIYNLLFAILAGLGYISPLVAVVIMPLSSISITFLGFSMMTRKMVGLA